MIPATRNISKVQSEEPIELEEILAGLLHNPIDSFGQYIIILLVQVAIINIQ